MISELDETIRQLLITKGPLDPVEIDIRFEIPDREWAATISKPTINCYLYDIHENRHLRQPGFVTVRDGMNGVKKRQHPWRIDLAYLITAWTKDVGDEHRLLWHVLATFFRNPVIPPELLQGQLREVDLEIPTSIGQPESTLRSPGEFWSALDNKLKPSLNYVVTLPLEQEIVTVAPLVLGADYRAQQAAPDPPFGTEHISGVVRAADGRPVVAARILFVGTNHTLTTDRDGRFRALAVPTGRHMLAVAAPGQFPRERELVVPSDSYDLSLGE